MKKINIDQLWHVLKLKTVLNNLCCTFFFKTFYYKSEILKAIITGKNEALAIPHESLKAWELFLRSLEFAYIKHKRSILTKRSLPRLIYLQILQRSTGVWTMESAQILAGSRKMKSFNKTGPCEHMYLGWPSGGPSRTTNT